MKYTIAKIFLKLSFPLISILLLFSSAQAWNRDYSAMIRIPHGCFIMGSEDKDINSETDEKPPHEVCLDSFYMDQYEVTNERYKKFLDENPEYPVPHNIDSKYNYWQDRSYPLGWERRPVINVSWQDANNFCRFAGKRLSTEAEWEYAALGGLKDIKYPWGNDEKSKDDVHARYAFEWDEGNGLILVGSFESNRYDLYDMAGNVWEWVGDKYKENYYTRSPKNNPTGPEDGECCVIRGGSWYSKKLSHLRIRNRFMIKNEPSRALRSVGFRCVKDVIKDKDSLDIALQEYILYLKGLDADDFKSLELALHYLKKNYIILPPMERDILFREFMKFHGRVRSNQHFDRYYYSDVNRQALYGIKFEGCGDYMESFESEGYMLSAARGLTSKVFLEYLTLRDLGPFGCSAKEHLDIMAVFQRLNAWENFLAKYPDFFLSDICKQVIEVNKRDALHILMTRLSRNEYSKEDNPKYAEFIDRYFNGSLLNYFEKKFEESNKIYSGEVLLRSSLLGKRSLVTNKHKEKILREMTDILNKEGSSYMKKKAINVLAEFGNEDYMPILEKVTNDVELRESALDAMNKIKGIYVPPEEKKRIKGISQLQIQNGAGIHNCDTPEKDKSYSRTWNRARYWFVISNDHEGVATAFWCRGKEGSYKYKLVVVAQKNNHRWQQCPSVIEAKRPYAFSFKPQNLILQDAGFSIVHDKSRYFFSCNNGEWEIQTIQ